MGSGISKAEAIDLKNRLSDGFVLNIVSSILRNCGHDWNEASNRTLCLLSDIKVPRNFDYLRAIYLSYGIDYFTEWVKVWDRNNWRDRQGGY